MRGPQGPPPQRGVAQSRVFKLTKSPSDEFIVTNLYVYSPYPLTLSLYGDRGVELRSSTVSPYHRKTSNQSSTSSVTTSSSSPLNPTTKFNPDMQDSHQHTEIGHNGA